MAWKSALRGHVAVVLPLAALVSAAFAQDAPPVQPSPVADGGVEEINVTARQKEESLLDVPVTVAAFSEADLDRYNVQTLTEASKLVPNFQIVQGNAGNGSNLFLRGVGSSSISAAFDQSVAINIDGVIGNIGRLIHNAYLDMDQLEVLKGPQSLYFGKSATAGVVSVRTKDPGEKLELELMSAYELDYDRIYTELIASSPITETLGARLAASWTRADKLRKNLSPAAKHRWRGEESTNARLTLVWDPVATLSARFKLNFSSFQNDGANGNTEARCLGAGGAIQGSDSTFGGVYANGYEDCKINGNFAISDANRVQATGMPFGGADGVPFLDQDTWLTSMELDWELTPSLVLTSVTGYLDLDHVELDVYCYCSPVTQLQSFTALAPPLPAPIPIPPSMPYGFYSGMHRNIYKGITQELRLVSDFDFPLNFMAGVFYQDIEQQFHAYQNAVNVGIYPSATGFLGALCAPTSPAANCLDPVTGNGYDYLKKHTLDSRAISAFVAGYWDITESLELTAGVRFTDENKHGKIKIPYMHQLLSVALGFLPSGTVVKQGLQFNDDNWSPEVALSWHITDRITAYGAYKQGFKSGGIDNSALPNNSLNTSNPDFPGALIYDSEKAKGFELGLKSRLFGDSLMLNATAFSYRYEDLQVQQFNSATIQFYTLNASELTTSGFEVDFGWTSPLAGLVLRGALALTDADYTKTFIQVDGQDLNGHPRERSAAFAGYVGGTYDVPIFGGWLLGLSTDLRYSSGYPLEGRVGSFEQDELWLSDTSIRLYSEDNRWEVAFIAKNLGDETYAFSDGSRPGAVPPVAGGVLDRLTTTSLGRELTLRLRFRY
jgi:iron complex outermembrane receptor protein